MKDIGEIHFNEANDLNVPVGIFLTKEDDENFYTLTADCYQPRKDLVKPQSFVATGTKEELQGIVKRKILPLYRNALKKVEAIAAGTKDGLYMWGE